MANVNVHEELGNILAQRDDVKIAVLIEQIRALTSPTQLVSDKQIKTLLIFINEMTDPSETRPLQCQETINFIILINTLPPPE